jgi:hypothetical protein
LTELYNSVIKTAPWVAREGSWSGVGGKGFRVGVLLTLVDGTAWLVHHAPDHKPVITQHTDMSRKWAEERSIGVHGRKTVGGVMKAGGEEVWSVWDNCVRMRTQVTDYLTS